MGTVQKRQAKAVRMDAPRAEFFIKGPAKDRLKFSIVARIRSTGKSTVIDNPQTQAINKAFKAGTMDHDQAKEAMQREVLRIRKEQDRINPLPKVKLWPANERILRNYWDTAYKHRRHQLKDKDAAFNRLRRAIEALGDTPLTASPDEIQTAIDSHVMANGGQQRTLIAATTQLLKFIGRHDVFLTPWKKRKPKVRYVTLDEFKQVAEHLPPMHKILCWIGFSTGARVGEIFAMTPDNFDQDDESIFIGEQMLRSRNPGDTKNERDRHCVLIDEGVPWLKKWFTIHKSEKAKLRNARHADIFGDACEKVFPDDPTKRLTFHDLRHCYAIHMLDNGVHPKFVAQSIGDSIQVLEDHYSTYALTKDGVKAMRAILKKAQK